MATNTYVALDKVTVGTATPSITFTGINQGYTDLIVVVSSTSTRSLFYRVGNGSVDSGSNYSRTQLIGDGSSASSGRASNENKAYMSLTTSGGVVYQTITQLNNYSNTTTYKTFLTRYNDAAVYTAALVSLWRSTAAINIITITGDGGDIPAGSTFSLYGIAAQPVATAKATGGTIYYGADGYTYHKFTSTGTFTPTVALTADILSVAGGGGGGNYHAGGGGAGGVLAFAAQSLTTTGYTCTVGGGGAGAPGPSATGNSGTQGSTTQFAALTASVGGGYGASNSNTGGTGGSGGGTKGGTGGSATSGQGFAGGGFTGGNSSGGGGGGGAGGVGVNSNDGAGKDGGPGVNTYTNWGSLTTALSVVGLGVSGLIAGGGGGGNSAGTGVAGLGQAGGGNGGLDNTNSTAASANTGSGGGGGGGDASNYYGSAGGSGFIIVRYVSI
jgi:hypothetical protein